jgi:hypothetical protein
MFLCVTHIFASTSTRVSLSCYEAISAAMISCLSSWLVCFSYCAHVRLYASGHSSTLCERDARIATHACVVAPVFDVHRPLGLTMTPACTQLQSMLEAKDQDLHGCKQMLSAEQHRASSAEDRHAAMQARCAQLERAMEHLRCKPIVFRFTGPSLSIA